MPLLFPGDPQRSMMAYQAMGPEGYFKASADNYKLTNEQRNLSPFARGAQPIDLAPFLNEAGKDGVQMRMGNDGTVQAFPVPGLDWIANIAVRHSQSTTDIAAHLNKAAYCISPRPSPEKKPITPMINGVFDL